ncbi:thermonuclease family protein [Ancylobacter lacus]|nr:thermonuclease family protein [Ancylobacter lacus]
MGGGELPGRRAPAAAFRFHAVLALALLVSAPVARAGVAEASVCGLGSGESARIAAVLEAGDLRLEDGRTVRLAGVVTDFGEDGQAAALRAVLERRLQGQTARLYPAGDVDRYGRQAAYLVAGEAGGRTLQEELLAAGLAVWRPGEATGPCREALAVAEGAAARARRGLWRVFPLPARNPAAVSRFEGRYAIVAGRVMSSGQTRQRDYLNFGPVWRKDFTVQIPGGARRAFAALGKEPQRLVMGDVSVRGVVFEEGGPAIEAWLPEQVERLATGRDAGADEGKAEAVER